MTNNLNINYKKGGFLYIILFSYYKILFFFICSYIYNKPIIYIKNNALTIILYFKTTSFLFE